MMPDCPFCQIKTPLLENNKAIVISDQFPVNPGHSLIIPKRHFSSYFSSTIEEKLAIFELLDKIREIIGAMIQIVNNFFTVVR